MKIVVECDRPDALGMTFDPYWDNSGWAEHDPPTWTYIFTLILLFFQICSLPVGLLIALSRDKLNSRFARLR